MAPSTNPDYQSTAGLAENGGQCQGQEHRGADTRPDRPRNITPAERELISQLRESGLNGYQIAAQIGRGKSVVYRYTHQGHHRPRWTDDENQILVDGYAAKLPVQEIAQRLPGRSPEAIRTAWHRHKKKIQADPKKQYALSMIVRALRAVRKADIMREMRSGRTR